ncbi:CREB-regulated transcription coactivator 3-like [Xiphias gladius]|uniref:CREB-regulated transcription coactivator 3-like n=1 Tax=Xiphias gladius TaxID=8245 RepID=UPI001A98CFAA|nr:CREB-regulated transcription coactivator 3-like [Xiphias gladius]
MMTAGFFLGASLLASLIVDLCCLPVKRGFNPSASYGSSYTNAAPSFGSNQGVPSSQLSPGVVIPNSAPSKHVSTPSHQPVLQQEPSFSQPAVQRELAASTSPSSSRPAVSGYRGSTMKPNPVSSTQPGAAFQPGLQDISWAVPPPGIFSGGEEMPAGTHGVSSSRVEYVSPPLPPPGPVYQAGELSHFEGTYENGDYQMETEEQGYLPPLPPPPPMHGSARQGLTSVPQPNSHFGVYPYYDYMFLTGQYPPGTVSHYSSSYEQGRDHWQDAHYVKDYALHSIGPSQQIETFTDFAAPQSFADPQVPVNTGYRQGGAAAGPHGSSHGSFRQPTYSQAGGYGPGKVAY